MIKNKLNIQPESEKEKNAYPMLFKAILHFSLVIIVHVELCLVLPIQSKVIYIIIYYNYNKVFFFDNYYLVICYILFCIYFYFSS